MTRLALRFAALTLTALLGALTALHIANALDTYARNMRPPGRPGWWER